MTSEILVTKLFIPSTRPEIIARPQLIKQLHHGLFRKLTLISAPAGFGKTTLVTEWLNDFKEKLPTSSHREIQDCLAFTGKKR